MPGKIETAKQDLHSHNADPQPSFCGSVGSDRKPPAFLARDSERDGRPGDLLWGGRKFFAAESSRQPAVARVVHGIVVRRTRKGLAMSETDTAATAGFGTRKPTIWDIAGVLNPFIERPLIRP